MNKSQPDSFNLSHTDLPLSSAAHFAEDFQVSKQQIIKAVAYIIIMALSLCGNTLVLVAVKKNIGGSMRSVRNYLLTSMAVIDLVITLGSMPERLTRALTNDEWLIKGAVGVALCKATNFFEKLSFSVSTLNVVLIAVDRFLAVMFPHKKYFTSRKAFAAIGLVWFLSAVYSSPVLYYGGLLQDDGKLLCKVRQFFPNWKAWYLLFLVQLLCSLVLVVILYASICYKLWRRQSKNKIGARSSFNSTRAVRDSKINRKVLKMVAVLLLAFYICFLPYWIGWVFCSYYYSKPICNDTFIFVAIYLSYANSSLNPFIYCIFSENFRRAFRLVVHGTCPWIARCRETEIDPRLPTPRLQATHALVELALESVVKIQDQAEIEPADDGYDKKTAITSPIQ